jgi:transposase
VDGAEAQEKSGTAAETQGCVPPLSIPTRGVISQINPVLRGWVNYFAVGHSSECFTFIQDWMDGPSFLAYVEKVLVPTLRKGDMVFMDNLRTHKIEGVWRVDGAFGATVRYLPTYSPDLNPIEQAFWKLKMPLRRVAARHCEGASQARRKARQDNCTS